MHIVAYSAFLLITLANCNFVMLYKRTNGTDENACIDYKNNFVKAYSDPNKSFEVKILSLEGTVYNLDGTPSCLNSKPTVPLPGILKLTHGEIIVPKKYDLIKSGILKLTVKSPSFSKPICTDGASNYPFLPNSFCSVNLCHFISNEICEFLQTPGKHTIRDMEQKIGFNSTLSLPEPPNLLGISLLDFFTGEYSFGFILETEDKPILEITIPKNFEFIQLGPENDNE